MGLGDYLVPLLAPAYHPPSEDGRSIQAHYLRRPGHYLKQLAASIYTQPHTGEYHSALKKMEALTMVTMWINLKDLMLSKVSQSP